jgi:hypothetical protein
MARKAKKMAALLAELYSTRHQPFRLTQKEFETLSGQGKMRTKFLRELEEDLRKRGYVLLDVHKERQMIGIESIETMAQWDIPTIHEDVPDDELPEEDGEENSQEPPPQVTQTSPRQDEEELE